MGNYCCIKCGVPADYYNKRSAELPSCRVHTYDDSNKCVCKGVNCYHIFRYKFILTKNKNYKPLKSPVNNDNLKKK
jgi:hypothetical protein